MAEPPRQSCAKAGLALDPVMNQRRRFPSPDGSATVHNVRDPAVTPIVASRSKEPFNFNPFPLRVLSILPAVAPQRALRTGQATG